MIRYWNTEIGLNVINGVYGEGYSFSPELFFINFMKKMHFYAKYSFVLRCS